MGTPRQSLLAIVVIASGCTAEPREVSIVLGDTTLVESMDPLLGSGRLTELGRIGSLDGPDELLFTEVSAFVVEPDGNVLVAELDGSLREFTHDGVYVRTIAERGQGPREVRYVTGMAFSDDGRLAVLDFGNQRVAIYGPDRQLLGHVHRPAGRPGYGRSAIQWDGDDLWVAVKALRQGPDTLAGGERPLYGRLTGDRTVVDTLFLPRRAWEGCSRRLRAYASGFWEDRRLPYLAMPHWARGTDGRIVFGCSARYELEVIRADGSVLRMTRPWTPSEMSEAEHAWTQEWVGRYVPKKRPAFLRVWATNDGRTWAWRGGPGNSWETSEDLRARGAPDVAWSYYQPTEGFDVFARDGAWLGHVETPGNYGIAPFPGSPDPQFFGDTVWAVTTDDLDVSYISQFVVEWN